MKENKCEYDVKIFGNLKRETYSRERLILSLQLEKS